MASEDWPVLPLGELTENFDGRRVPVKEIDRKPGPYPYYGASGIVDLVDGYLFDGEYLLIGEDGENLRTRQTPIAFIAKGKFWVNNHAHIVRGNHRADTRFLSYVLSQTDIGGYLTGSTMPKLTQGNLNRVPVIVPPLAEQKAIAAVLGALDDKIELNRRMNATLKAMARALFQSWFVDFDPVRAKLDGRQPVGMDEATAALFPARFQDSTVGPIPHGWGACTLGDIANNVSITFDFKRTPEVVFINTGDVLEGDFLHSKRSIHACLPGQAKKSIRPNDILFSEIRPANKRYAYVDFDSSDYVVSTKFMIIRGSKDIHPRLLYRILTKQETLDEFQLQAESRSGTFPQITFDSISHLPMVLPTIEVQEAFQRAVGNFDDQIKINNHQSHTLATLRDTLLPKLLSGELSIEEECRAMKGKVNGQA